MKSRMGLGALRFFFRKVKEIVERVLLNSDNGEMWEEGLSEAVRWSDKQLKREAHWPPEESNFMTTSWGVFIPSPVMQDKIRQHGTS